MSILKKPAKGLTPDDYAKIQKPLGERVPYPGMGLGYVTGANGQRKLTRYLGVLDKPLMVTSERDLDEVEGLLIRNMPTPEMLKLFFEVMSAINPQNERRAMYLKGAPGAGKTFLGELAGRVSAEDGAIKVDCTNMNLNELFFETVLDFNANKRFYDALNTKVDKYNALAGNESAQAGVLNPLSVDILEDCLGSAFSKQDGKICIDWAGAKHGHHDKRGKPIETRESIALVIEGLKKVSAKEGLDSLGGNALGMATQEGPAWQAYNEGRVLILDELNRAKRGTFGILHGWMQFIINEIPECRVRNPLKEKGDQTKSELLFRRDKMAAGHFVFMTGNTEDDSDEVLELPEALSSRVVPDPIAKATVQGWQHRWCQILTGMPISTLYYAQHDVWDKNKEEFGKKLIEWRELREDREVPAHQFAMLRRWEDVLEATENLARFMDSASKAIDPDSEWHKAGTLAQLLDDISDTFKKEVSVDFRKIGYFINKASQAKPSVRPPQNGNGHEIVPLVKSEDVPDSPEEIQAKLGSHLTYVILDWIISNTYERGKDDLGNQLMQLAKDCALVDTELAEALPSQRRTIAQLLDDNAFATSNPDVRAAFVRDLMCDYLRQNYPGLSRDNETVLPEKAVKAAIEDVANSGKGVVVFNDNKEKIASHPFIKAKGYDMAPREIEGAIKSPPAPDKNQLLSQYAILASLAAPELRDHNLPNFWNDALSRSGIVSLGQGDMVDEGLAMAENKSAKDIAVTTLTVRNGAKEEKPLHIIWNKAEDSVLVVGEGDVTLNMKKAFNNASVTYIDRTAANAEEQFNAGFAAVIGSQAGKLRDTVRDAFMLRNSRSDAGMADPSLEDLLLKKDTACHVPHYMLKAAP